MTAVCTEGLITLHPGDVATALRGQTLETLLGSCVAIALTDRHRTVGALCHFVHPRPAPAAELDNAAYADVALRRLVKQLQQLGLAASLCDAHVYGGGNMFPDIVSGPGLGAANARVAIEGLQALGARLLTVDVGGLASRRVRWTIGDAAPQVRGAGR